MATPVFNHNKTQLILKLESTMGTAATLGASDNDIKWIPESISLDFEAEEFFQWYASGRHSQGPATLGKRKAMVKARAPLLLGSALGTAPKIGKALKSCGATETIVASTSVTYTPDATKDQGDNINCTLGLIFVPTSGSAILATVKGAMGNFRLIMDQGGFPFMVEFDWTGAFVGITDGSALALTSPDTGYAPGTLGNTCTIAAVAQPIAKMEMNAGNTIELDEDTAEATGYAAAYISKREPTLSIDPKARLLAVDPAYTRLVNNTEVAFAINSAAVGGIRNALAMPKIQLQPFKFGKRGTELTWEQTYRAHENTGNDEWSISQAA